MQFIYLDKRIAVVVKPAGVLATDEPGGLPELVRRALGDEQACVRTVHRLDRVVGGLTVLARSVRAASELSRQIREGTFQKEYLAVVHGCPEPEQGRMEDLLRRDKRLRTTFVADEPGPDARTAALEYARLDSAAGLSLVRVHLLTGRTHQIRCQFASRGMPLAGDRKYGAGGTAARWRCGRINCVLCIRRPVRNWNSCRRRRIFTHFPDFCLKTERILFFNFHF